MKYKVMFNRWNKLEPASHLLGKEFDTQEEAQKQIDVMHMGARQYYEVHPVTEAQPAVKLNPKRANARTRLPLHLCPPTLIIEVARVMDFCGEKSDPTRYAYNWRDSETSLTDYIDAMKRHIAALEDGEWTDPVSGRPHVAHIASSCGIVLDSEKAGTLVKDTPEKSCGVAQQLQDYEDAQKSGQKTTTGRVRWGVFFTEDGFKTSKRSEDEPGTFNTYEECSAAATRQNGINEDMGLTYFSKELTSSEL